MGRDFGEGGLAKAETVNARDCLLVRLARLNIMRLPLSILCPYSFNDIELLNRLLLTAIILEFWVSNLTKNLANL